MLDELNERCMSIDFGGLFEARVPGVDAFWLKSQLVQGPPELASVIDEYRPRWQIQDWTCKFHHISKQFDLWGPGGFWFGFDGRMISVYHVIRASWFASDPQARMKLRQVWNYIAKLLDSPYAIYTHELMPCKGGTLDAVVESLRTHIGPPASTYLELASSDLFGPGSWYIDDFHDLRS